MAITYGNLINKGGTIYNTLTGKGYSSPADLAKDLGISTSSINWGNITKNDSYTPGEKFSGGSDTSTSNNNNNNNTDNQPLQMPPGYPASGQSSTSTPTNTNNNQTNTPANNVAATPSNVNFTDSAAYKALSPDEQAMINTMYNTYASGTSQQQQLLVQATSAAVANADPYYKSLLDITMGEYGAQIAGENNNYAAQSAIINQTQQNLLANVTNQEGGLSLENQADLQKIAINYNDQILGIQKSAGDTGTAEGTGYGTMDYSTNLATSQEQNTVMSTNAAYNTQLKSLQLQASQGDTMAQLQLNQLQAAHNANVQNIGTQAEQAVGTTNVGNIAGLQQAGYTPYGNQNGNSGFIGTVPQAENQDILTGIANYLGIAQPSVTSQ